MSAHKIAKSWNKNPRWLGINRDYTPADVMKLRGPHRIRYSIASMGAVRLWRYLSRSEPVRALGAITGNQAVQMAQAGLKAIYVSGWQTAADFNGQTYPDQSLYPSDCVPKLVKSINNALLRQSQIESINGEISRGWLLPLVADAEAGFGGKLNAYELMRSMIEAGAAAVHFEDQLSSEKKCGHLGGKVLVPIREFVDKLKAARLAADVCGVPTVLIARTDANSAKLATKWNKEEDEFYVKEHFDGGVQYKSTDDGFFRITGGLDMAIARGLAYAPYADLLWCETSTPDLDEARAFADAIHKEFPGKMLAYNKSPSFNWNKNLSTQEIATFHEELYKMGYVFQFITLAGFHSLNSAMFKLASEYRDKDMIAFSELQNTEVAQEMFGFKALKHQSFVGTGYFDEVSRVISGGTSSTGAMKDSTEVSQFDA